MLQLRLEDRFIAEALTSPQHLWVIWSQVASALAYCHYGLKEVQDEGDSKFIFEPEWVSILHRDVKPSNSKMPRKFNLELCRTDPISTFCLSPQYLEQWTQYCRQISGFWGWVYIRL